MSEYLWVEKPFLQQLATLGWEVIDQGKGIPQNPAQSRRNSFQEVFLSQHFKKQISLLNVTEKGKPWLTEKQLQDLYDQLLHPPGNSLAEVNQAVLQMLFRVQVDCNELTGEESPNVKLIDFQYPERNHFLAINQFRIDTPSHDKNFIIPDIVLFVNGLPLVVVECKKSNTIEANPIHAAFEQLLRYQNQREETLAAGLQEGAPKLFYTNQLLIRTTRKQTEFGTITAQDESHFFPWKEVWPPVENTIDLSQEQEQETLIQGMLAPKILLDIIQNCTLFQEEKEKRIKLVCRYQQYRAMLKMIDSLRNGQTSEERSGVIWHTQGSGKSLTMAFLIRKLRNCEDLKDFKVCLINDRLDLEEQLSKTAKLTGEKVNLITSRDQLKLKLSSPASDLNMVMIHKFQEERQAVEPTYLKEVLNSAPQNSASQDSVPRYESFGVVNESNRILMSFNNIKKIWWQSLWT